MFKVLHKSLVIVDSKCKEFHNNYIDCSSKSPQSSNGDNYPIQKNSRTSWALYLPSSVITIIVPLDVLTANFTFAVYIRLCVRLSPFSPLPLTLYLLLPSFPPLPPLSLFLFFFSQSPIPRPWTSASLLTVQFLLFLSLCLSVCERV